MVSLLLELGRDLSNPLRCEGLLLGLDGAVPANWQITLHFPNYRERQVGFGLSAQPPSRGFSGTLPTLTKASQRSPELRHQLAVFLSDLAQESASQRKNAASIPVHLFWAFSEVTLAEEQMVATISLAS